MNDNNLLPKEERGIITLSDTVRVTDPCYDMDVWCAGTIRNVLPGKFECFSQKTNKGNWEIRIANIEIRHKDYPDVEPTEYLSDIHIGVDSGQCGLFDKTYFSDICKNKETKDNFYDTVDALTYIKKEINNPNYTTFEKSKYFKPEFKILNHQSIEDVFKDYETLNAMKEALKKEKDKSVRKLMKKKLEAEPLYAGYIRNKIKYESDDCSKKTIVGGGYEANIIDDKGFVSASGDGDGSYICFVGRNKEGKVVSIKVDYYPDYELLEEMESEENEQSI